MAKVTLTINDKTETCEIENRTLLVQLLREHLQLTGTHVGCDTTQCGACTVHVDGKAVKSCTVLAVSLDGVSVKTIEGMADGETLHPVQQAFYENHGLQCGFCTPGIVMAAADMIGRHDGQLDEKVVREELDGNLCRCTGYQNIVKAILAASESHRSADPQSGSLGSSDV
ncbi:(2Fe-2S)-binding protein [Hoeflea sp.]|uniref:(2Fe-2S)-binding protein n=1 Tax=Hoeflea sp. TaxID=1940281 RepID=UPI003B01E009